MQIEKDNMILYIEKQTALQPTRIEWIYQGCRIHIQDTKKICSSILLTWKIGNSNL